MRTIAVASRKGGVGKTTLSGHLAVEAEAKAGGPVAIIDADPQGGLAAWWNARKAETPAFLTTANRALEQVATEAAGQGFNLLIIDTPPQASGMISRVLRLADLVLIPTRPSPHDLRAIGSTVDLAEAAGKPIVFVLNGAARARITAHAAVALGQHGPVAPVILHQRIDYATSMTDGRTAGEMPRVSRSAAEISELWTYLQQRLNRKELRHDATARRLA